MSEALYLKSLHQILLYQSCQSWQMQRGFYLEQRQEFLSWCISAQLSQLVWPWHSHRYFWQDFFITELPISQRTGGHSHPTAQTEQGRRTLQQSLLLFFKDFLPSLLQPGAKNFGKNLKPKPPSCTLIPFPTPFTRNGQTPEKTPEKPQWTLPLPKEIQL